MELAIELSAEAGAAGKSAKMTGRFFAPKIVVCSQYADLRTSDDKLIATVTWTSDVTARVIRRHRASDRCST